MRRSAWNAKVKRGSVTQDISSEMLAIVAAWLALVVMVSRMTLRGPSSSIGLPLAFLLAMTFSYCGCLGYLVPGYTHLRPGGSLYLASYDFNEETVLLGATASLIGVLGFAIGCWIGGQKRRRPRLGIGNTSLYISPVHRRTILLSLGVYGGSSFFLGWFDIPFLEGFFRVGECVAVATICLGAALVVLVDRKRRYLFWVVLAALIPVVYLCLYASVSQGFYFFTIFVSFWLAVLAPSRLSSLKIGLFGTLIFYGVLCSFVAWMSFRDGLREQLRSNAITRLSDRLHDLIVGFSTIEFLTPASDAALDLLNARLNQYIFVGKAIEWHAYNPQLYLYGESLYLAPLAIIPRAVWPGKPTMGGSQFISIHTGMTFSKDVTFGAGQVLEFYANFGYAGVLFGFLALGIVARWIDRSASTALRQGRFLEFVRWFVTGLAFIAPLTDFFFLFNLALLSWIVMTGMMMILRFGARAGVDGMVAAGPIGVRRLSRQSSQCPLAKQ